MQVCKDRKVFIMVPGCFISFHVGLLKEEIVEGTIERVELCSGGIFTILPDGAVINVVFSILCRSL